MYIMICYTHIYILYTPTTPVFEFEVKLLYPQTNIEAWLELQAQEWLVLGTPSCTDLRSVPSLEHMNIDNPALGKGPCWDPHAIVTPAIVGAQSWSIVHMLLHSPSCSPRKRVWVYIANVGNPLHAGDRCDRTRGPIYHCWILLVATVWRWAIWT